VALRPPFQLMVDVVEATLPKSFCVVSAEFDAAIRSARKLPLPTYEFRAVLPTVVLSLTCVELLPLSQSALILPVTVQVSLTSVREAPAPVTPTGMPSLTALLPVPLAVNVPSLFAPVPPPTTVTLVVCL